MFFVFKHYYVTLINQGEFIVCTKGRKYYLRVSTFPQQHLCHLQNMINCLNCLETM